MAERHGHCWRGGCSPTYSSWRAMIARCKYDGPYRDRGITVCDRWTDFRLFLEDMGERPEGTSIDRVDGTRGYYPGNCRWATPAEQAANRENPWNTGPTGRRTNAMLGVCGNGHDLQVVGVYTNGQERPRCKACQAERSARYHARLRGAR